MTAKKPDTDIHVHASLRRRIREKKERVDRLRPLPKEALKRLRDELRLAHTYNSNAIEGNTLTLAETKLVLEEGLTIGGKTLKEHLEATGNAAAFDRVEELARGRKALDHVMVQEIHELVTRGQLTDSGRYRMHNVRIAGTTVRLPDWSKVVGLMDGLLEEVRGVSKDPIVAAAYLHHRFVRIHPFSDGNGRVARLLMNLLLMKAGYPPVILKKEERRRYYSYLETGDRGELGPFLNFIAKGVDESLMLLLSAFGGEDELVPLAELAKGTPYSQEYLSLRARQGALDALKLGKVWHSTRKALNEYIKGHRS